MLPKTAQASYQMKGSIKCPDSPFCASAENEEIAKSASTTTSKDVRPVERRIQLDNLDVKHSHGVRFNRPSMSLARLSLTKSKTRPPTNPFKEQT